MVTGETGNRVGYILKMFPRLSETFVLNEILELQRQQVCVHPFSLRAPEDGRFHAGLAGLETAVEYVGNAKLEPLWSRLTRLPEDERPGAAGWSRAVDFLRRHEQPKELETLLRACWIAARCRRAGVQHLHAHFATISTRVACLVHLLTGLPYSFTAHAKDIFRDDVDVPLFTELACRASFMITVSDFNRAFILDRFREIPAEKVVKLYNGINLEQFRPPAAEVDGDMPRIVSVGRLAGPSAKTCSLCGMLWILPGKCDSQALWPTTRCARSAKAPR
jgi:glycosyltransferase involved in cell wall biosynthesis